MKITELMRATEGILLNQDANLEKEAKGGFAADLMSDVLASIQPDSILVTGLSNPQVIRTAVMADISAIVLVSGKTPPVETLELARLEKIPLISTSMGMYQVCGKLFAAGLPSFENNCQEIFLPE